MRQEEDQEFKTSLSFRVRSCLRKPKEDDEDKEGENGKGEEEKGKGKEKGRSGCAKFSLGIDF